MEKVVLELDYEDFSKLLTLLTGLLSFKGTREAEWARYLLRKLERGVKK